MGFLASAKGIDFGVFKDKGVRKLIACCVAMICITAMAMSGLEKELLTEASKIVLYLTGLLVGGNLAEHAFRSNPPTKEHDKE